MKYIKLNIIFLLFIIATQSSFAQKFYIQLSDKEVPLNYTVDVTFTVENGNLENFTPPKFSGFDAYGRMQSNQTNIINGNVSRSVSLTYTLQPKSKGTFTIPEASAIINGKKYITKSFTIKVIDEAKQPQHQQQQNAWPFPDPFSNQGKKSKPKSSDQLKADIAKNFFVKVTANKSTVYEGDQLTLIYKIYYRIQAQGLYVTKAPSYNNFLSEEFDVDLNKEPEIESYNGQKYYTNEFRRVVLFPQKAGKVSIEPMEFQSVVMVEMPDPYFDNPFFTIPQPYEYKFKCNDLNINVLPLPQPAPKNFSGAVGNFSFKANYDKTKVKVGEPIQLNLTYTGTGNLKLITAPKLIFPDDFEAYPPKTIDNYDNKGAVDGSKTFEYTLIPQDGGTFKMPAYEFGYFNPEQGKYVSFNLPETEIEVTGKAKPSVNLLNFKKREKEELKQNELQNIEKELNHQSKLYNSNIFYGTIGISSILFLLAFFFRQRDYSDAELLGKRRSKANKMALKRLKYANTLMKSNQEKPFYNEVIRALWQYVSDKLHITTTDLSKENMAVQLTNKNIQQNKIDELIVMLNNCEEALFASQGKQDTMQQTYNTAINWITDVDLMINKNNEK